MRKITPRKISTFATRFAAIEAEAKRRGIPSDLMRWDGATGRPVFDTKAIAKAAVELIRPELIAESLAK